jgi:ATP-dependent Clp protease ATP-binding subunit ClpB
MTGCTSKLLDPDRTGREAQRLEADLRQRIVGQEEAIQQVIQVYQTNVAGMSSPGRPIANLLFLGPTGSGKTRLVEVLAESVVGTSKAVLKVDCGEFQHSHEIAKLIGSPPGYLGHRETHALLTQEALNQYHTDKFKLSFLLFDEIEKASDALWHLLLGILDRATLTLGDNRRVDFSQTLIFMTSNLGAAEMNSILHPRVGFAACESELNHNVGLVDQELTDKITRAGVEAACRKFTPEFMNRLDKTVVFRPLGVAELRGILTIELNAVQERIFSAPNLPPFVIAVTNPAREYLLKQGTDLKYGARHLKRAIDRLLVHPLSNLIATGQVSGGDVIRIDFDGDPERLKFFKEASRANAAVTSRVATSSDNLAGGALGTQTGIEPLGWLKVKSTKR